MSGVCHTHKNVFVHVPKTGGTSMYSQPFLNGRQTHAPAKKLLGKNTKGYFSFGFVRNPYDRLLSIYCGAIQHATKWPEVERCKDFNEFVKKLHWKSMVRPHTLPMVYFLCDDNLRVLVDFVGRYENLQQDWQEACRRIGVKPKPLPRINRTKHDPWEQVYAKESIGIVNEIYQHDFEVFGYEKQ